jgi:hypothetical protein
MTSHLDKYIKPFEKPVEVRELKSIDKWKYITSALLIIMSIFMLTDYFLPTKTINDKLVQYNFENTTGFVVKTDNGYHFIASLANTENSFRNTDIRLEVTPLMKYVRTYYLSKEKYYYKYHPNESVTDYIYFTLLLIIVSVLHFFNFKNFQLQLGIWFFKIILSLCYFIIVVSFG